ncbi:MAG: SpaA isopeptide-forming pilin-related protein [Atopobiaceae bacterium]|jgi:LPXTG-motif cell wall-anchored protein|nr:LPXTG cell wall anchor domain-containing protein [Atopobiaceae bacterium]MCI1226478.1 LPXTG cell wall anchor domain-containing protein [Atopobiaceae bacterium]MDD3176240.1 SpaA isopeptide-forming pilin-related protein [Atopobiaceae bacterium]MDD3485303.1 SpaA isopeptide-forming pilin-related protein [Atopobiaceae bacterium]MDD4381365.1 SpaA isopeptide-forming pilin-related protein [Atopobiaceae bacterium]
MSLPRHGRLAAMLATLALIALAVVALVPTPARADDTVTLTADGGVSDFTTDVRVQKLAADTHEAVTGAHLQIIDASSGTVVEDWTTDGFTKEFAKELNVDTTYTLHEVSAPDGYEVAPDVRFTINATDGEVTLVGSVSSSDSEVVDKRTLNLYDAKVVAETTVVTQQEVGAATSATTGGSQAGFTLPKTGDATSYTLLGMLAMVGVGVAALGLRARYRQG